MSTHNTNTQSRHARHPSAIEDEDVENYLSTVSRRRLSKITGISRPHISRVLSGDRQITLGKANTLAEALGITVEQLSNYTAAQLARRAASEADKILEAVHRQEDGIQSNDQS